MWILVGGIILVYGLSGLAGGVIPESWLRRRKEALVAFAAGAMLAAAFVDILPEVVDSAGPSVLLYAFAGFLATMLLDVFVADRRSARHPANLALLVADALHNTADGAAIAAAFLVSAPLGMTVATAMIAHELPQEIGDYAVLRALGWPRRRALIALAAAQLSAGLGAAAVGVVAGFASATAAVLAIAAGALIHLGATDLLPRIETIASPTERFRALASFFFGVLVIVALHALET